MLWDVKMVGSSGLRALSFGVDGGGGGVQLEAETETSIKVM